MIKYLIRDYFDAFRIANLRQKLGTAFSKSILLPVMCAFSNIFVGQLQKSTFAWTDAVQFLAVLLPMWFSYFSMAVHPIQLSKMMYLCPMNEEDRRKYIYSSYLFRIIIHMSISFLGFWIAAGSSRWDCFTVAWILTNQLISATLVNGGAQTGSGMPVVGELLFLFALIEAVLQIDCMRGEDSDKWIFNLCMLIFFCAVQVPLEWIYMKYIRKSLQSAVLYEDSQRWIKGIC